MSYAIIHFKLQLKPPNSDEVFKRYLTDYSCVNVTTHHEHFTLIV